MVGVPLSKSAFFGKMFQRAVCLPIWADLGSSRYRGGQLSGRNEEAANA